MLRFFAGVAAAILLMTGGLFVYRGWAADDRILPAAPPPRVAVAEAPPEPVAAVPEATARTREEKRFDRYDKDRDGIVTREEYLASRRKAFAKLDVNGDGRLSFDEWAVRTTGKFAGADRDKSGTLNRAEFATTAVQRKAPARKPRCDCPSPARAADDGED